MKSRDATQVRKSQARGMILASPELNRAEISPSRPDSFPWSFTRGAIHPLAAHFNMSFAKSEHAPRLNRLAPLRYTNFGSCHYGVQRAAAEDLLHRPPQGPEADFFLHP